MPKDTDRVGAREAMARVRWAGFRVWGFRVLGFRGLVCRKRAPMTMTHTVTILHYDLSHILVIQAPGSKRTTYTLSHPIDIWLHLLVRTPVFLNKQNSSFAIYPYCTVNQKP